MDLLHVVKDSKKIQKNLKKIICMLSIVLVAFLYGENGISAIPIKDIEVGNVEEFKNGYIYYFSVEFHKE